ncbi:MAG TPA: murein biosynthesis integral membrane protein MurJ [Acidimicrobiales bacterium]|nr:murein biosynthesis integral membrane protein MurJ [Acidimicrobiales bacterium]
MSDENPPADPPGASGAERDGTRDDDAEIDRPGDGDPHTGTGDTGADDAGADDTGADEPTAPATVAPGGAEPSGVGRATAVMAVGTTLSRVTGVIRIIVLAYALGTSTHLADAYNLANTLPNIIHDIVLGGVLSATFIPVFVQRLTTRTDDEAWEAISAVTSVTLIVIAAASVVFLVLSPLLIDATTALNHSTQAAQDRHVATELLILFVPQLTCYGFISLGTALLNARRRFGAPMFSAIANNVVLIAVVLYYGITVHRAARNIGGLAHDRGQLLLLGLGTTAGVVAQAGLMVPSLRRAGLKLTWRPDFRHEAVRTILRLSGWTFGLVVANQVALIVILTLAGHTQGAVSAYTYAWTFFQLPYGVVAVSIMSATAPELTAHWSRGDLVAFRRRLATGLRTTMAIVVPAAAGELVLSHPLVALLLAHGVTTVSDTVPTATSLALLALGLPGFCVFLYAVRVLQSVQDLRSAFWLYVFENGVNIVAAVVLVGPLGVVRGIALSITIAYTLAAVAALLHLRTRVRGLDGGLVVGPLLHVTAATAALVVAAALGSNVTASESNLGLLLRVAVGSLAGGGAFVLTAGVLGGRGRPPAGRPPRRGPEPPDPPDDPPPRGRRGRNGLPPRPAPLPPAGRPPLRPSRLGPTRPSGPRSPDRGRLGA